MIQEAQEVQAETEAKMQETQAEVRAETRAEMQAEMQETQAEVRAVVQAEMRALQAQIDSNAPKLTAQLKASPEHPIQYLISLN